MKYKIGNKVKVKSLEWYNDNKNKDGRIYCNNNVIFQPNMSKFCGDIFTIKNINEDMGSYMVEENSYHWTDDMFEDFTEDVVQLVLSGYTTSANLSGHTTRVSKISKTQIDSEVCEDEVEIILNDYEIETRGDKTYAVKKKSKYPKSYEECCGILGMTFDYPDIRMVSIDEYNLYSSFIQLIRCRDSYWKLADNWKPNWNNDADYFYTIKYKSAHIRLYNCTDEYAILAFPTEEMRDAFYKNFKELIEKCKELL